MRLTTTELSEAIEETASKARIKVKRQECKIQTKSGKIGQKLLNIPKAFFPALHIYFVLMFLMVYTNLLMH